MTTNTKTSRFEATLQRMAKAGDQLPCAFVLLPKEASDLLPRRGRTSVDGAINGHPFIATLEPDGQLSHWMRVDAALLTAAGLEIGDTVSFEISPVEQEPEPEMPSDFHDALMASPEAQVTWHDTTTIARVDWIHWITSPKQAKTRAQRIKNACDMLTSGKRRVCCFDPSGYYSKAFSAPKSGTGTS